MGQLYYIHYACIYIYHIYSKGMWPTSTITTDSPKLPRQISARQKLKQRLGNEAADLPECHDEFGIGLNNPVFSLNFWSASKKNQLYCRGPCFWDQVVPKVQVGEQKICERYTHIKKSPWPKMAKVRIVHDCPDNPQMHCDIFQLTSTSWENQLGNPPIHIFS